MLKLKHIIKTILSESYNISVTGADEEFPALETLLDITFAIQYKALNPLEKMTPEEKKIFNTWRVSDILTPDGEDVFKTTGTINFYIGGIPMRLVQEICKKITEQLDNIGIECGQFRKDKSGAYNSDVIRIPVIKNPNIYQGPPEMNISQGNATMLLHDILGFGEKEDQYYSIPVDQLDNALKRWTDLSDEQMMHALQKHTRPTTIDKGDNKATMIFGGVDHDQLFSYLRRLGDIVDWAKSHGYKHISAS